MLPNDVSDRECPLVERAPEAVIPRLSATGFLGLPTDRRLSGRPTTSATCPWAYGRRRIGRGVPRLPLECGLTGAATTETLGARLNWGRRRRVDFAVLSRFTEFPLQRSFQFVPPPVLVLETRNGVSKQSPKLWVQLHYR
jgi:hypothetical protein